MQSAREADKVPKTDERREGDMQKAHGSSSLLLVAIN